MSKSLRKALATVFVLGAVVCFSSLLFLVIFFNFSVLPSVPIIISVVVCAAFQLAAYLGGVVFQKQMWPAILCMLACSIGTVWAGMVGPGSLYGMPGTIIMDLERAFSTPMYLATLPVTIVGFCTGIAYFVLGVASLISDSRLIQREREADAVAAKAAKAEPKEPPDKTAIYAQVADKLGVPEAPTEILEAAEEAAQEDCDTEEAEGSTSVNEEETTEKPDEATVPAPAEDREDVAAGDEPMPSGDEPTEILPEILGEQELVTEKLPSANEGGVADTAAREEPAGFAISRYLAKIFAFFVAEQPVEDNEESSAFEITAETPSAPLEEAAQLAEKAANSAEADVEDEDIEIEAKAPSSQVAVPDEPPAQQDSEPEAPQAGVDEEDTPEPPVTVAEADPEDAPKSESESPEEDNPVPADMELKETELKEGEEASPDFLAEKRADLLAQWADTPHTAVPPEDLLVALETERLRIMRLDKRTFSALLQGIEEMEAATGLTPSGEQLDPHTMDTFGSLYTQALADEANYKWFAVWIIASREENKLLGSAGFKGGPDGNGEVQLSCGVNETRNGQDYAGEAIVALCQWALLQKDVRAVMAQADLAEDAEEQAKQAGLVRVHEADNSIWRLEK